MVSEELTAQYLRNSQENILGSVQIILGTDHRSLRYIIEGADKVIRNNENRIVKNLSASAGHEVREKCI